MGITIGMIGLSHPHSPAYLRTLDALASVEGVVACDADSELRERVAREHPKVRSSCAEPGELWERADVPVVLVALPTNRVPDTVISAARAGKHIFCEKPCARSAREMQPVLAALEAARVRFAVAYLWRANPAIRKMRELLGDGALGRLVAVDLRMVTTQVWMRDPSHWLFRREIAGGGILSWLGCHWLDLLRYLTGQEVAEVGAMVETRSGEAIDVEDVASVQLRLADGTLASLQAGYLLAFGRAGYQGARYDNRLVLWGTEGFLQHRVEGTEHIVALESRASRWRAAPRQVYRFTLPDIAAYGGAHGLEFFEDFLESAIDGKGSPLATETDALRVLEILDAAYRSAATGRIVPVDRAVPNA